MYRPLQKILIYLSYLILSLSWPQRCHNSKRISYLNSLTQKTYISICIMAKRWIWIFDLWSEVRGQLVASERSNKKNYAIFELLDPKNLCFNIHQDFEFFTSDQRSEVIWWPLIGHIEKTMSFLNSLTQKTYISMYIMVKGCFSIFDLWSEVRGHLVTSERFE